MACGLGAGGESIDPPAYDRNTAWGAFETSVDSNRSVQFVAMGAPEEGCSSSVTGADLKTLLEAV
jgi:hypothetical protein